MAAILKSKVVTATTSKYCFDLTIIFLGHNNEGIHAQTIYIYCSLWEIFINLHSGWQPYCITRWPPLNVLINPSLSHRPKRCHSYYNRVSILFSVRDIVKTAVRRCPFCDQRWCTKTFPVQMETLVFGFGKRSELSKNVYVYNSPKNMNENI